MQVNSSLPVATLHWGLMRSLWAYIEGMDGLGLLSEGANSSDLAAWAGFGTWALFKGRLLLQYVWVQVNSSQPAAALSLGPMRSLWAYIEGMMHLISFFRGQTAPIWQFGADLAL